MMWHVEEARLAVPSAVFQLLIRSDYQTKHTPPGRAAIFTRVLGHFLPNENELENDETITTQLFPTDVMSNSSGA